MQTHTVKVFDSRNRSVFSVRSNEANILVGCGYAKWENKRRQSLSIAITKHQLILFVAQMRYKPTPQATGMDSRTHAVSGPGTYRHVRNDTYFGGLHRVVPIVGAPLEAAALIR